MLNGFQILSWNYREKVRTGECSQAAECRRPASASAAGMLPRPNHPYPSSVRRLDTEHYVLAASAHGTALVWETKPVILV